MAKANQYLGSSILSQNGKMKETSKINNVKLFNFGIPAYKTREGKMTCPFADKCIKFCYAQKGSYSWSPVKQAFERRYQLTKDESFVSVMSGAITVKKVTHLRIHDSGDFYSMKYLQDWMQIISSNPERLFYFYTKSVKLVKDYINEFGLPSNVNAVFSFGGKQDHLIDIEKDSHSVIFDSKSDLDAAGYTDCSKDDLLVFTTRKVGLILH